MGQTNLLAARPTDGANVTLSDGSVLTLSEPPATAEVLLSIRPEKATVHAARPPGANVLVATVVERLFKGAFEQVLLRTTGGLDLSVVTAGGSAMSEGTRVYAQMGSEDIWIVKPGDGTGKPAQKTPLDPPRRRAVGEGENE